MTECLILAAGRGSRMGAHSAELPKGIIPFLGTSLLDWQFQALKEVGIEKVNLVCGYQREKFSNMGLKLWENKRWDKTNMVESMFCARPLLESANALIVAYSDIIYEARVVRKLLETKNNISVTVDLNWKRLWEVRSDDPLADAESLRMDSRYIITDIGRKVSSMDQIQAQYMGLIYFSRKGLDGMIEFYDSASTGDYWLQGRDKFNCYMTDLLWGLVTSGQVVNAVPVHGGWLEFDTENDLDCYEALARSNKLSEFICLGKEI